MTHLVHIHPKTITFPASLGFESDAKLHLQNISHSKLAYKLTTPQCTVYSAHPYAGVILPRSKAEVTLTQHIDKALSYASDGHHGFQLHVVNLNLVPVSKSSGAFHGFPTVEELFNAASQNAVTVKEIVVNGIFGTLGSGCETKVYAVGNGDVIHSKSTLGVNTSPLSVTSSGQIYPQQVAKSPVVHLNPSGKQKKSEYTKNKSKVTKRASGSVADPRIHFWDECIKVPPNVTFYVTPGIESSVTLELSNVSRFRFAYKVLTNQVDRYIVRPNMGLLESYSEVAIRIQQQAFPSFPKDLNDCQDQFLLRVADLEELSREGIIPMKITHNSAVDLSRVFVPEVEISTHVKSTRIAVQMKGTWMGV